MEIIQQTAVYLLKTLVFRAWMFFRRWYVHGFFALYGIWLWLVRASERRLAIRVNIRFLFQPLYQEKNIAGYALGFFYRFFKILLGGVWYTSTACVMILLYIVWAAFPLMLIYKIING